jgi:hypothetical protein
LKRNNCSKDVDGVSGRKRSKLRRAELRSALMTFDTFTISVTLDKSLPLWVSDSSTKISEEQEGE